MLQTHVSFNCRRLFFILSYMIASRSFMVRVPRNPRCIQVLMLSSRPISAEQLEVMNKRNSHYEFMKNRKWKKVEQFWSDIVRNSATLLPFIEGDENFGVTNLKELNKAGERGEFASKDIRYSNRRTFAIRIGYVGTLYNGFQRQANVENVYTVEDDLKNMIGGAAYGAGRTDAEVSAVSQVVSITGKIEDTAEKLLIKFRACDAVLSGRLAVYDCVRVPKKFNARSCATWRRYLYLLPLNEGSLGGFDIDVDFVNEALKRIENIELPYNGFAFQEDRTLGEGMKDFCTMYRARAFLVDTSRSDTDLISDTKLAEIGSGTGAEMGIIDMDQNSVVSSSPQPVPVDGSTLSVSNTEFKSTFDHLTDVNKVEPASYTPTSSALCVELVGSRFLRKMVRTLVATVARESSLPASGRNVNILLDICNTRDRSRAAVSVPGVGLCFAGVGYDALDLALYKFMPKIKMQKIEAENELLMKSYGTYLHSPIRWDVESRSHPDSPAHST